MPSISAFLFDIPIISRKCINIAPGRSFFNAWHKDGAVI